MPGRCRRGRRTRPGTRRAWNCRPSSVARLAARAARVAGLGHAGQVALDVGHEHRHAGRRTAARRSPAASWSCRCRWRSTIRPWRLTIRSGSLTVAAVTTAPSCTPRPRSSAAPSVAYAVVIVCAKSAIWTPREILPSAQPTPEVNGLPRTRRVGLGWACRQDTDMRRAAERRVARRCQRPPVERTIESPMASPSPAPEPCSVARWNRSNRSGRSASGMPGPLSSTVRLSPAALGADLDPDRAVRARVPAGVVDQDPGQPVDPLRRRADQHGAVRVSALTAGPTARNRSAQAWASVARSTGSLPGGGGWSRTWPATACPRPAGAAAGSRPGSGAASRGIRRPPAGADRRHVDLGPDHAERGTQLVRGVGGELELAAARLLDRGQRAQADDQQAPNMASSRNGPAMISMSSIRRWVCWSSSTFWLRPPASLAGPAPPSAGTGARRPGRGDRPSRRAGGPR